jgi:sigma-B regulation protein RsbU (phosphoserine phosphatase)
VPLEQDRSLAEIESMDELLLQLMDLAKEVTAAEASKIFLCNSNSRSVEIDSIKDDRFGDKADELFKGTVKLKMGEGRRVWAFTEPAASVGGDLHDVILLATK